MNSAKRFNAQHNYESDEKKCAEVSEQRAYGRLIELLHGVASRAILSGGGCSLWQGVFQPPARY
jgi:hypothetical protein